MEKRNTNIPDFGQTYSGICAVPDWKGRFCRWKTVPCLTDTEATYILNVHINEMHQGNNSAIGYVNLTGIITKLDL